MATTINGSTGASQIQDNTVSNAKVADDVLTASLSASGTPDATVYLRGDNAWAAPGGGGVTHLGTMTTTSGTTQTLSDLDLSIYNVLMISINQVS